MESVSDVCTLIDKLKNVVHKIILNRSHGYLNYQTIKTNRISNIRVIDSLITIACADNYWINKLNILNVRAASLKYVKC